jgi:outer membrane protein
MRWMIVSILVALPAYAQADLLMHALDGQTPGGTGSGSAAPTSQENDLVTWAGEAKPITLPELLQLAIRQAPALASAKLDIAVAEAQIAETWARHDWTVGAQVNFSRTGSSVFSGIELQAQTNASASVDIGRVLPTGGTIDLKVDTNYAHADAAPPIFPESTYWTSDIVGSITQPLLKGYGSDLYNAQERRATLTRDVAVLARRLAALNTIEAVVSAYWDLVLAEQQVAITEQSLALARERLRVTEIQVKGGKVADAEVPAVQQIIATREEDVLNGELTAIARSRCAARSACRSARTSSGYA